MRRPVRSRPTWRLGSIEVPTPLPAPRFHPHSLLAMFPGPVPAGVRVAGRVLPSLPRELGPQGPSAVTRTRRRSAPRMSYTFFQAAPASAGARGRCIVSRDRLIHLAGYPEPVEQHSQLPGYRHHGPLLVPTRPGSSITSRAKWPLKSICQSPFGYGSSNRCQSRWVLRSAASSPFRRRMPVIVEGAGGRA